MGCVLESLPFLENIWLSQSFLDFIFFMSIFHLHPFLPFRIENVKTNSYHCLLFERRKFKRGKYLHSNSYQIYCRTKSAHSCIFLADGIPRQIRFSVTKFLIYCFSFYSSLIYMPEMKILFILFK